MLEIKDIIELKATDTEDKLSFATRYLVQVNFTFDLTVISDKFSGTAHFCVRKEEIEKLCTDLGKMQSTLCGTARIEDNDSEAYIEFTINKANRILIGGQIGGEHEGNFMRYNFTIDSVATNSMIKEFNTLLLYVDDDPYEKKYNRKYRK